MQSLVLAWCWLWAPGAAGRTGRKPEVSGLHGLSTPSPFNSAPDQEHSAFSTFLRAPARQWLGHGFVGKRGWGAGCSFPLSRKDTVWRGRGILACAQTQAEHLTVCMLICLHCEKEIAEIPKKIASCQRLIVNSDRKVPRNG